MTLLLLEIYLFAICYANAFSENKSNLCSEDQNKAPFCIIGSIDQPVEEYEDKIRIYITVDTLSDSNNVRLPYNKRIKTDIYDLEIPDLAYGDKIKLKARLKKPKGYRNPGNFDYRTYLHNRKIYFSGSVSKKLASEIQILEKNSQSKCLRYIYKLRRKIAHLAFNTINCSDTSSLFMALVLGDKSKIRREIKNLFQYSGSAHILSISGLHIGFVTIFLFLIIFLSKQLIPMQWFHENNNLYILYRLFNVLTIIPIIFYVVITGMKISTLRSSIMFILYIISLSVDREQDLYTTLTWAAFIILLWKPFSLFEPGFQLTFLATLSIIFYVKQNPMVFKKNLNNLALLNLKILNLFLISLVVIYFISPITAFYFQQISPGGIFIMPIFIPFLSIIIPAGILSAITYPFSTNLSILLIKGCGIIIKTMLYVMKCINKIPYLSFRVSTPGIMPIVIFYLTILLIIYKWKPFSLKGIIMLLCTFLLFLFLSQVNPIHCSLKKFQKNKSSEDTIKIYYLDVGNGDASLLQIPSKHINILVDGGGTYDNNFDIGQHVLQPFLNYRQVKKIDFMVLSHPHPDHINGLFAIISHFTVNEIWIAPETINHTTYKALKSLIEKYNVKERIIKTGDTIPLSSHIVIQILQSDSKAIVSPRSYNSQINNQSVVLKFTYKDISFLYAGDIEKEAERELISRYKNNKLLPSTFIKIPHHGSKYSSSLEFLQAVSPKTAIISTRETSWYQMPAQKTLDRLSSLNIKTYRTDLDGCIKIITDGDDYTISTWNCSRKNMLFSNHIIKW